MKNIFSSIKHNLGRNQNRKKILAGVLTVCLLMSLAVWKGPNIIKSFLADKETASIIESPEDTQDNLRNTVLYYKDDKGYLVPVMRKIPWPEGRGIGKAALRSLVDNPANRSDIEALGLAPILPPNTEILGMNIKDGLSTVSFTSDILNYSSKEEEELILKGIVYTLTEFPTIDEVEIMIDNKRISTLPYGTDVSKPLTRQDINYDGTYKGGHKVVVYYQGTANGIDKYFVPVTKDVEINSYEELTAIRVLEELVEGPPEGSGLFTILPEGLQVKNVDVINGVAYVDFSEEIKEVKDEEVAESIIKSIALTLKDYYKNEVLIEHISILANGRDFKLGNIDTEEPVAVPTFANEY